MFDMICPENGTAFRLMDLKKSPLSIRLLNALINWRKFYAQEVTEGALLCYIIRFYQVELRLIKLIQIVGTERVLDENGRELSDWERFCSEEYETMMENEEEVDENL